MTRALSRPWLVGLLLAVAAALFLFPLAARPQGFPFTPGASYSDALIAHLSSAFFLHRAVETWGQIPLWNPTILSGMPFAADPLSGLWYPPLWLLALFPGAPVINLLFWLHLVLGGWGMFLLLRSENLTRLAALTGGLAFAGMPKIVGHVGLGHLTLVSAVCWTPWVLLSVGRAVDGAGYPQSIRAFLISGGVAGIVFLADP
ncbi:MAG: putative membrane protein, partial [Anaerolineales bacterium]|nr:putative membrane protein [Anaerolineales bacterium]